MKKYLPYLERYSQWIALGLGAVFVLFMVYSYVITPPVSATVNGRKVDLGDVDHVTREGPAKDLESAIQRGASTNTLDQITVQPLLPKFLAQLTNAGDPVVKSPLNAANWNAPTKLPFIPGMPTPPKPNTPANLASGAQPPQVALLTPPTAIYVGLSTGRSSVTPPPDPVVQPVAPDPNNPNAAPPVQPIQPVQPVQPVQAVQPLAAGNNPAAPAVPSLDKNWVAIHYKIPSGALADAFKKANVPAVRSSTSFLRVELTRQEKLPDGTWGKPTVVPLTLAFLDAPAWPNGAAPDPVAEQAYITWAQTHAQNILQPAFYNVLKGDQPGLPGDPLVQVGLPGVQPKVFDPNNPGLPPPGGFTAEQKAAIIAANKAKAAQRSAAHPVAPRTPTRAPTRAPARGGKGGSVGGGDAAFAPLDSQRPLLLAQVRTPVRRPAINPDSVPEDAAADGGMGSTAGIIQQTNNEALNKLLQTIPQPNNFDPAQLIADVDVIAYDETPEPGKTYRYQMRYYILNPILGSTNLVKNPAQAQQFALPSSPTDFSLPVEVQPVISFFLSSGGFGADSIKLDLYRWQNGDVNRTTQQVVAGDHVGLTTKDGIDYNTKWTVVDIRGANADRYVLLQDTDGNLIRREFRTDQSSPVKHALDAQATAAEAAAKAATASTPPTPGTPTNTPTLTH